MGFRVPPLAAGKNPACHPAAAMMVIAGVLEHQEDESVSATHRDSLPLYLHIADKGFLPAPEEGLQTNLHLIVQGEEGLVRLVRDFIILQSWEASIVTSEFYFPSSSTTVTPSVCVCVC